LKITKTVFYSIDYISRFIRNVNLIQIDLSMLLHITFWYYKCRNGRRFSWNQVSVVFRRHQEQLFSYRQFMSGNDVLVYVVKTLQIKIKKKTTMVAGNVKKI